MFRDNGGDLLPGEMAVLLRKTTAGVPAMAALQMRFESNTVYIYIYLLFCFKS